MNGHVDLRKKASLRHLSNSHQQAKSRPSGSLDGHGQEESSSGARSPRSNVNSSPSSSLGRNTAQHSGGDDERRALPAPSTPPKRQKSSGGFLLASTLRRRRTPGTERHDDTKTSRSKGKGKDRQTDETHLDGTESVSDRNSLPHSSPRSGRPSREETNGNTTLYEAEESGESPRSSHYSKDGRMQSSALDPAQLIQMALSLSEGRKRYASAGMATHAQSADTRRVRSTGAHMTAPVAGSPLAVDDFSRDAAFARHGLHSPQLNDISPEHPVIPGIHDLESLSEFHFSQSTLARADRARRFFELSAEYRRVLQYLPPLKPDSTSAGNFTVSTQNTPGSDYPEIMRTRSNIASKHILGREYNPLQYLRNNRARQRERCSFEPVSAVYEDTELVRQYVDRVEVSSNGPLYRSDMDVVNLPPLEVHGDDRRGSVVQTSAGHRRTDTVSSKFQWTDSVWTVTPMNLLADLVWVEDPHNKSLLENRSGRRLFPGLSSISGNGSPKAKHQDDSLTTNRKRSGTVSKDSNAAAGRKAQKRRKFPSIHHADGDGKNRLSFKRRKSDDDLSESEMSTDEMRPLSSDAKDENVGPLRRHMERVMTEEDDMVSPELASPERWDPLPSERDHNQQVVEPSIPAPTGKLEPRRQSLRPRPLEITRARSYTEGLPGPHADSRPFVFEKDLDSNSPDFLSVRSALPMMGKNRSSPRDTSSSSQRMSSSSKEPHSPGSSRDLEKVEQTDFAMPTKIPNEAPVDLESTARHSFESVRSSILQRQDTTSSVAGDRRKNATKTAPNGEGKSHGRTISRLLKGGRIGELVRGESAVLGDRFRRMEPARESDKTLDESDTAESDDELVMKKTPTDSSTAQSRTERSRYHVPLPSFRSAAAYAETSAAGDFTDPISRQQSARRDQNLFSRLNRMAPPRLNVSDANDTDATYSDIDSKSARPRRSIDEERRVGLLSPVKLYRSMTQQGSRVSLGRPGSIRGPPTTALSKIEYKPGRDQGVSDRRHWSIADRGAPQKAAQHVVKARDIAMVRALYLSSGVKAHELCRRADTPSESTPGFLLSVATKCGVQLDKKVPQKEQIPMAVRLLSRSLDTAMRQSQSDIEAFRGPTTTQYRSRVEDLRQQAAEKLTLRVQETTDDAETFITDLNTHQTLAVQQVNDAINDMLRARRRRLRWLRRIGWTALEWLLLGVMWCVWFVVVIINLIKGTVGAVIRSVRWLLWV